MNSARSGGRHAENPLLRSAAEQPCQVLPANLGSDTGGHGGGPLGTAAL